MLEQDVNSTSQPSENPPDDGSDKAEIEVFKPSTRTILIFLTLCVLTFMVALDGTSIAVALPVCNLSLLFNHLSPRLYGISVLTLLHWNRS